MEVFNLLLTVLGDVAGSIPAAAWIASVLGGISLGLISIHLERKANDEQH